MNFQAARGETFVRQFALSGTDDDGASWVSTMFDDITFCLRSEPAADGVTDDSGVLIKIQMSGDVISPAGAGSLTFPADNVNGVVRIERSAMLELPTDMTLYWDVWGSIDDSAAENRTPVLASGTLEVTKPITLEP
jgi:hypothetical protein